MKLVSSIHTIPSLDTLTLPDIILLIRPHPVLPIHLISWKQVYHFLLSHLIISQCPLNHLGFSNSFSSSFIDSRYLRKRASGGNNPGKGESALLSSTRHRSSLHVPIFLGDPNLPVLIIKPASHPEGRLDGSDSWETSWRLFLPPFLNL